MSIKGNTLSVLRALPVLSRWPGAYGLLEEVRELVEPVVNSAGFRRLIRDMERNRKIVAKMLEISVESLKEEGRVARMSVSIEEKHGTEEKVSVLVYVLSHRKVKGTEHSAQQGLIYTNEIAIE